jgi:murein L,D-transpeptidase YafK
MNFLAKFAFSTFLLCQGLAYAAPIKYVKVTKHLRLLEVIDENDSVVKSYPVMIGRSLTLGPKVQEGDYKTPEGIYELDWRNPNSKFYKSLHVSYPNKEDSERARVLGVNPGGDIMLHGFPNDLFEIKEWIKDNNLENSPEEVIRAALSYSNWTNGCIAITNEQIEELYKLLPIPTQIQILP